MKLEAYLSRLQYQGTTNNNLETLKKLHKAHVHAVPFENLNIHHKIWIELDTAKIYHKIVENNRGGFCYEVNGLLYEALQQMDFRCYFISCSVFNHLTQEYMPYFGHVAIIVENEDALWLTDVGFGSSFPKPLKVIYNVLQIQQGIQYKLTPINDTEILLERSEDGIEFLKMYKFTLTPRKLSDFKPMCEYHQTSPHSPFTQRKICSIATPNGRVTLTTQALIITENGKKTEMPIANEEEFQQKLLEYFGLDEKTMG